MRYIPPGCTAVKPWNFPTEGAIIGGGPGRFKLHFIFVPEVQKPTVFEKMSAGWNARFTVFPSFKLEKNVVDAEIK